MPIIINIDVMLARRKMSVTELSELDIILFRCYS
jgi:DNA-binding Xre family transcriptional regulator